MYVRVVVWVVLMAVNGSIGPRVAIDHNAELHHQEVLQPRQETSPMNFRLIKINDGKLDSKHWFKEFEIEGSNGHSLSWERDMLSTPARASGQLQRFTKRAAEILRRAPELDGAGRVVGERILARFQGDRLAKPPANIQHFGLSWTSVSDFHQIVTEHLEDLLAFEVWLKGHSFRDLMKDQPPTCRVGPTPR